MKRKTVFGLTVILVMVVVTMLIIFCSNDWNTVVQTLASLDLRWIAMAFACWFASAVFDAFTLSYYLGRQQYPVSIPYALYVSMIGYFYSAITPGSSGGQPAQVYCLSKRKVPVGASTSFTVVRFALSQLAIVVICALMWLLAPALIHGQLVPARPFIVLGWAIHLIGVLLIVLATYCKAFLQKTADMLIRIGEKTYFLKSSGSAAAKLHAGINSHHEHVRAAMQYPGQLLFLTLFSVVSLFFTMATSVCIYRAFHLTGVSAAEVLIVAFMLHLSASYNPLPGASGAQEGGFLLFYRGVFPAGTASLVMLIWRFFTYYIHLIVGGFIQLYHKLTHQPMLASADDAESSSTRSRKERLWTFL